MAKDPQVEQTSNDGDQPHRSKNRATSGEFSDTQQDIQWKWHPQQKFFYELLVWLAVVAWVYVYEADFFESGEWGLAVVLAMVGWIFPAFRLFQWWRLHNKSELDL